jgi:hypothetical protein
LAAAQQGPAIGNITSAGSTCSTTSTPTNCVILQLDTATSSATIQVAGTYVGTNQFEVSSDNQVTWANVSCTPPNSATAVSSTTSTGLWQCNVAGYTHIRARGSAYTSGTAAININSGHSVPSIVTGVSGATTTTSGTASAVTQPGYPMICDSATSGSVTAGQAQMVRCNTAGLLETVTAIGTSDGQTVANGACSMTSNGSALCPLVYPFTKVSGSNIFNAQFVCDKTAKLNALAAATTQIVALAASQKIRVCSMSVSNNNATATTLKMVEGTGSNCGTGTADVTSLWNIGATTTSPIFMAWGNGGAIITTTAADALCFTSSAASSLEITITYAQF